MNARRTTVLAAAVVLVLLGLPSVATATERPVGVDVGDGDPVTRAVDVAGLYPTAERQLVLFAGADARRMAIRVERLRDRENGCLRPETRDGDTTCGDGAGQGELSAFLDLTATPGRVEGNGCTPAGASATAVLRDLTGEPAVVGLPDDRGRLCVIATVRHRDAADDDLTQTDSAHFDLHLSTDARPVPRPSDAGSAGTGPTGSGAAGSGVTGSGAGGPSGRQDFGDGAGTAGAGGGGGGGAVTAVAADLDGPATVPPGTVYPVRASGDGVLSLGPERVGETSGAGPLLLAGGGVLGALCVGALVWGLRSRQQLRDGTAA